MPNPFSRHRRGEHIPAACLRCKATEDIIDLGAEDIRDYGRPYLCTLCSSELAQALGFIDPSVHEAQITHWQGVAEGHMIALAESRAGSGDKSTLIERKTRELADGIRNLANDFARGITGVADSGSTGIPVPERDEDPTPTERGAGDLPREGDGDADATGAERERLGGDPVRVVEGIPDDSALLGAGGDEAPADDDPAGDGSELDASFEWIERVAEAPLYDPAVDLDDARD